MQSWSGSREGSSHSKRRYEEDDDEEEGDETSQDQNKRANINPPEVIFRLLISSRSIGHVIGRQGTKIQNIRDQTRANIRINNSSPHIQERLVTIWSKNDDDHEYCAAEDALFILYQSSIDAKTIAMKDDGQHHASSSNSSNPSTEGMEVDSPKSSSSHEQYSVARLLLAASQAGAIIGKGGCHIEEMRNISGAKIKLLLYDSYPCSLPDDRILQITGELSQVKSAMREVCKTLKENPPRPETIKAILDPNAGSTYNSSSSPKSKSSSEPSSSHGGKSSGSHSSDTPLFHTEIVFPNSKIGAVIGAGGLTINNIRQISGASIKVSKSVTGDDNRIIEIDGTVEQVTAAQNFLSALYLKG